MRLYFSAKSVILSCIYRPHSAKPNRQNQLHILLGKLSDMKEPHIIVGELNINLLSDTSFADTLKADFYLAQLITEPMRITSSTATLIDHLILHTRPP